jgi:serine/threonine protein kinase
MENKVLGHCRLIRKLGEGGMGVVWLARHETLDKDVAVKVLPDGLGEGEEAVQRFLREAKSAARLDHPNVVQVLDAGATDGVHFIVMQFVDGTDLQKIIAKKGKLSVGDALSVAKKIAQALGAAHKLGLIHRDIKPANILITKQGRVQVADFGLARDIKSDGTLTNADEVIGTPQYLSPEQARGEKLDGRSDLYSLGGTLYCMLSGRPPFSGRTPISIAVKHASQTEKPQPLRELLPDLSPEVEALVEKLMAKNVEDRCQSAEEAVAAIDRLKSPQGTLAQVSEDRVLTPQKKRKLIFVGAGSALGGLLALLLLLGALGPSQAEKAFRQAASMATDPEKLVRFRQVKDRYPDTEWAQKALDEIRAIRARSLSQELGQIRAPALSGKQGFHDAIPRLDRLRGEFSKEKEGLKAIDALEAELHRARVLARTRDLGEALRLHKPGDSGDRFKDFIAPEAFRKVGEGGVMFWVRAALDFFTEFGGRVEVVEVVPEGVAIQPRQTAVVPVRAVIHNRKKNERTNSRPTIHWIWQEGDWYLAEKWLQPEGAK